MTRVLIAHNEPIRAKGLETVLTAGGLEVAAVCHDVFELFEALEHCRPEIAILDMSVLTAPEVAYDLRRRARQCQMLLWPQLTLSDSPTRVVEAIHMMANFSGPDLSPAALVNLACSPEDRRLIALCGYGLNDGQIAAAMGANRSATQKSLRSISDRLGTEDRYELALYGLTMLNERRM
jgi:DNA-binding NarL/FixJ family response regulator